MLCNLIKRGMIYGYFLFVGYQLFITLSGNTKFAESINKFETQHSKYFEQIYQKVPQLVQYKFAKYPAALIGFSALSVLLGGFGIFALLSHALITYLSNEKIVALVKSINPKMDVVKFAQSLELETILMIVLYLGIICQFVYTIFSSSSSSCCASKTVSEPVAPEQVRDNSTGSNNKKKQKK